MNTSGLSLLVFYVLWLKNSNNDIKFVLQKSMELDRNAFLFLFFSNVIVFCVRMCGKEGKMCTLSLNNNASNH